MAINLASSHDAPNLGVLLTGPVHLANKVAVTLQGGQGTLLRGSVLYQNNSLVGGGKCFLVTADMIAVTPTATTTVTPTASATVEGTIENTLVYDTETPPALTGVTSVFTGTVTPEVTATADTEVTHAGPMLLYILENDTDTGTAEAPADIVAAAYDSGHFSRTALKFGADVLLTEDIEVMLRHQGIYLDYSVA